MEDLGTGLPLQSKQGSLRISGEEDDLINDEENFLLVCTLQLMAALSLQNLGPKALESSWTPLSYLPSLGQETED